MKGIRILIPLFIVFSSCAVFGQQCLKFSYDADGNRTTLKVVSCGGNVFSDVIGHHDRDASLDTLYDEENVDDIATVKVYPNPTKGGLFIVSDLEYIDSYELYDNCGLRLSAGAITDTETHIDISDKISGTYVLRVFGDNESLLFLVIKN